tara:strand:+ start:957 stop:1262 length:306 start_codon:yes stop_codon:yes gene_type:complete
MGKVAKVIRFDKDGEQFQSDISGDSVTELKTNCQDTEDGPVDPCPSCDENLFYTSEVTKRIAILDGDQQVSGWICPSCFTEFDNNDNILILMSRSSIQGKA